MNENPDVKQANKTLYIALAVIVILIIGLFTNGFGLFGKSSNSVTVIPNPQLEIGNSPVLGNPDAKVTIYEFSDFSCPFCAAADGENQQYMNSLKSQVKGWEPPVPNIIEEYAKTGKAKIVFKYLKTHGTGQAAHVVASGLKKQSDTLFWQFHELAFANQADTGDIIKMKALAQQLGANITQLDEYIASGAFNSEFENDKNMAIANGVQGTPSFIIGNILVDKNGI